ncbi:MAG: flagellar FliJ family protein [Microthrixaceae bacterium]
MKRYRFALGGIQRVRRIAEENARQATAEAQREADRATAELHARLADIGAALPSPGVRTGSEFLADRENLDRHRQAVLAARTAEANALDTLASRRTDWIAAAKSLRAIDRMEERHREAWTAEATRAAQLLTDEIAVTRFRSESER